MVVCYFVSALYYACTRKGQGGKFVKGALIQNHSAINALLAECVALCYANYKRS